MTLPPSPLPLPSATPPPPPPLPSKQNETGQNVPTKRAGDLFVGNGSVYQVSRGMKWTSWVEIMMCVKDNMDICIFIALGRAWKWESPPGGEFLWKLPLGLCVLSPMCTSACTYQWWVELSRIGIQAGLCVGRGAQRPLVGGFVSCSSRVSTGMWRGNSPGTTCVVIEMMLWFITGSSY